MMPPPIRYPLPTLVLVLVLSLLAWRGASWIGAVRQAIAARWQHAVEGPAVPASSTPQVVAGPIIRRALLLRDDTPVAPRPDAKADDVIARRSFVDIYDVWPLQGAPTHLRVGNRRPLGWVAAADCLAWDTRLVAKLDGVVPVVGWRAGEVEVVRWQADRPWSAVARREWIKSSDLPLGVLVAREELPGLLAMAVAANDPASRDGVRLRAVLGRLLDAAGASSADVAAARSALPAEVFERRDAANASDRIAVINAEGKADAEWGGHALRFVPIEDLP